MPIKKTLGNAWQKTGQMLFGYDAVKNTSRRRAPTSNNASEDATLPAHKRSKLTATTRDVQRNFSVAGWGIRKHLDYVSTFNFQSKTGNDIFDRRLEELMKWWSLPKNCDIRGKHSLAQITRIAEQSRVIDGDVLISRLRTGHLQAIESDRIANPTLGSIPKDMDLTNAVQGVILNKVGAATGYIINKRGTWGGSLTFEKVVRANNAFHLGYYDRFDQVRGVSRLAASINTFQDLYEGLTYALAKAKISQLFGLVTYREGNSPLSDLEEEEDSEGNTKYKVDFGIGPFHLDLDDGDKAEILESRTPSHELQDFSQITIAMALKSLDIPFSFYAENFSNYSGSRQALLAYEQSASIKRQDLVGFLNWVTFWKITQWISTGTLVLPAGMRFNQVRWDWISVGLPWIDPLKEVNAHIAAINAGITSRQKVAKATGEDWFEIVDELEQEEKIMANKKIFIGKRNGVVTDGGVENVNSGTD